MSYAAPESSEASQGLYDSSYDGSRVNGELQGGLGRLVDGEFGADNFRLDIGYGKGNLTNRKFLEEIIFFYNSQVTDGFLGKTTVFLTATWNSRSNLTKYVILPKCTSSLTIFLVEMFRLVFTII